MSEYQVSLKWESDSEDFSYKKYTRTHEWTFGGGTRVKASAAPEYLGKTELVNPEEAFAASLASCHLLTFLAIASYKNFQVESYNDEITAVVAKNENHKLAVTKVILRPKVKFNGDKSPEKAELKKMHDKAHEECFISNSVSTEVVIDLEDAAGQADGGASKGVVAGGRSQNIESAAEMKAHENTNRRTP